MPPTRPAGVLLGQLGPTAQPGPARRTPRARLVRGSRALVALCRSRLAAGGAGRAARIVGIVSVTGFALAAVVLRVSDGADASLSGLTFTATRWLAWTSGALLALAAAENRVSLDRREGIEALAALHGISPSGVEAARALAAMSAVGLAIGLPVAGLSLLTAALAGRGAVAFHRAELGIGALVFAAIAGVTLGGAGAMCGRLGRGRGRWLFAAVIVGPWVLADLTGRGAFSIPGALDAVLDFLLGARGALA